MITTRLFSVVGLSLALAAPGSAMAASWQYSERKDPITDATKAMAVLLTDSGGVAVKCDKNGSNVMYLQVVSKSYLTVGDHSLHVSMRIDGGPVIQKFWEGQGNSVVLPYWENAASYAPSLGEAKSIVFRITNASDTNVDIVLDADGNDAAVRRAFATCGQAYPK